MAQKGIDRYLGLPSCELEERLTMTEGNHSKSVRKSRRFVKAALTRVSAQEKEAERKAAPIRETRVIIDSLFKLNTGSIIKRYRSGFKLAHDADRTSDQILILDSDYQIIRCCNDLKGALKIMEDLHGRHLHRQKYARSTWKRFEKKRREQEEENYRHATKKSEEESEPIEESS